MKTKWKILAALTSQVVLMACAAEKSPVATMFTAIRAGNYSEQCERYTFPGLRTNDIPELLVLTGSTNILKDFPVNGVSSIDRMAVSEGMIARWLIEGIKVGGEFASLIPVCYDRNKAVPHGALFYREADQDAVAKAYDSWWKETKAQSNEIAPLDGTSLTWFGSRTPGDKEK